MQDQHLYKIRDKNKNLTLKTKIWANTLQRLQMVPESHSEIPPAWVYHRRSINSFVCGKPKLAGFQNEIAEPFVIVVMLLRPVPFKPNEIFVLIADFVEMVDPPRFIKKLLHLLRKLKGLP